MLPRCRSARAGNRSRTPGPIPSAGPRPGCSLLALVTLALGTAAGFVVARDRAVEDVELRLDQDARRAARALETEVGEVTLLLNGAEVIVADDGTLDVPIFRTYADDLLDDNDIPGIGLVAVVDEAGRADFEAAAGFPLRAVVDGQVVPAPPADVHYPIVAIVPDDLGPAALGVDLATTPIERGARRGRPGPTRPSSVACPTSRGAAIPGWWCCARSTAVATATPSV